MRAWASSFDRDRYRAYDTSDGLYIQPTPSDDVVEALKDSNDDLIRAQGAFRLSGRYEIDRKKESAEAIGLDELAADIVAARNLLESPPSIGGPDPWDIAASVSAAALKAHLLAGAGLSDDELSFAIETVFRIGEGETGPREFEFEETLFEQGADRSAARAVPLLLLPAAARIRAVVDHGDGWAAFERAAHAAVNLAQAVANEVRLHLARGLDEVWKTPCAVEGRCHHEVGWRIATETMRRCRLGGWERATGRRSILALGRPHHRIACPRRRPIDSRVSPRRSDTSAGTGRRGRHLRHDAGSRPSVDSPGRAAAVAAQPGASRHGSSQHPYSRQRTRSAHAGRTWR